MSKKIICLYGGPCSGKSGIAHELCGLLKKSAFQAEINEEKVKDWIWENRPINQGDQHYIFAKHCKKERDLVRNSIDYIINDCPLLITHYYGLKFDEFERDYNTSRHGLKQHHEFVKFKGYKCEHFFLDRPDHYSEIGRFQTKQESEKIDLEILELLREFNINYQRFQTQKDTASKIYECITKN